jgi:hypothetical protein
MITKIRNIRPLGQYSIQYVRPACPPTLPSFQASFLLRTTDSSGGTTTVRLHQGKNTLLLGWRDCRWWSLGSSPSGFFLLLLPSPAPCTLHLHRLFPCPGVHAPCCCCSFLTWARTIFPSAPASWQVQSSWTSRTTFPSSLSLIITHTARSSEFPVRVLLLAPRSRPIGVQWFFFQVDLDVGECRLYINDPRARERMYRETARRTKRSLQSSTRALAAAAAAANKQANIPIPTYVLRVARECTA